MKSPDEMSEAEVLDELRIFRRKILKSRASLQPKDRPKLNWLPPDEFYRLAALMDQLEYWRGGMPVAVDGVFFGGVHFFPLEVK